MKKKLINNVALTGLALIATGLTRIIYNIAIARSFDVEILGQANLALSIAMLLSMTVYLITENSASKFLSEYSSKSDQQRIFTMLQKWQFIGLFLIIMVAYVLRNYILQQIQIEYDLYISSLFIVFLLASHHLYRGCFYGLDSVNKYFVLEMLSCTLFFLSLIATIYVYRQNLLLPFLAYYGAFSILGAISLREYFRPTIKPLNQAKDIGIYGLISMVGTLASTSSSYIANIFTGFYLSPEPVGFYSAAVSITAILVYAPTITGRVLLPIMSSSYGMRDVDKIKELIELSTNWLSMVAFFLGGIFIILSREVLEIMFTPAFAEATFSLQMLILGLCLSTMVVPSVIALSSTKYVKIPNAAGVIGLFASLAVWPFLIPRFGIDGTAAGYIIGSSIVSIIILYYCKKYYPINLKQLSEISFTCILIFLVSIGAAKLLPIYQNWIASGLYAILFLMIFKTKILEFFYKLK